MAADPAKDSTRAQGARIEALAAAFLCERGLTPIAANANARGGELDLVMRDGAEFDAADLRRHCLAELGNYKCPSRFVLMDELPRGPSGKLQRLRLLDQPA